MTPSLRETLTKVLAAHRWVADEDRNGFVPTQFNAGQILQVLDAILPTLDAREAALRAELRQALSTGLTLSELTATNIARAARWHPGGLSEWSALEWAGAMAGEAGEACNAAKKLKRVEGSLKNINTEPGRSLTDLESARHQVGKEVADTIIYGVLLAAAVGVDIEAVVVEVFNRKSEEYDFPERLLIPATSSTPEQLSKFQREMQGFSERGIWPNGAPNDEQRSYDAGFKSALAHVAGALQLILEGRPYAEYQP